MSTRDKVLAGLGIFVLGVLLCAMFFLGRGCSAKPAPLPPVTGIDAGPGDRAIAAALDGSVQRANEELARIEREHAAAIAAFDEQQRHKYDVIRAGGPDAASAFIRAFNANLKDAGSR